MKKVAITLILIFVGIYLQAQDYQISFTGSGASTTVDSVKVENLTQGTSLTLVGSDILHLVGGIGISSILNGKDKLQISPNPFNESSRIQFYYERQIIAELEIIDMNEKQIIKHTQTIQHGNNVFEISGLVSGIYLVNLSTSEWQSSAKLISINNNAGIPTLKYKNENYSQNNEMFKLKNLNSLIQMQYNTGDLLEVTGFSYNYLKILTLIPTQSQTINFDFVLSDADGNIYNIVTIGSQAWMAENLKTTHYSDGTALVDGTDAGSIAGNYTTRYWFVYDDSLYNKATYGLLYTWAAVMNGSTSSNSNPSGVHGVCPTGWHVPSDAEWTTFTNYLGGEGVAGGKLKETGTSHWLPPNTGATNESGFTALPGGYRYDGGTFDVIGDGGYWWSSTEDGTDYAWDRGVYYDYGYVGRGYDGEGYGFSVRCVRDSN